MTTGRPKPALAVSDEERIQLRSLAGARTLPHALVSRAKLCCGPLRAKRIHKSHVGCTGPRLQLANGDNALFSIDWLACMTSYARDCRVASRTNKCARCRASPAAGTHWTVLQEAEAVASPSQPCIGYSRPSRYNHIGPRRCVTSWVCN